MLKLGIIGYPLEHTLSPAMHTAALQYLNISGSYRAHEVPEKELEKTFNLLKGSGMRGFNVTIPHKANIIPLLDNLTENAKLACAVNTVTFDKNKKSIGDNTDITGFWDSLPEEIKKTIPQMTVSILGSGGSAYAVSFALLQHKAKKITVFGRTREKVSELNQFLTSRKEILHSNSIIQTASFDKTSFTDTDILINTTPVGMFPFTDSSPVEKSALETLPKHALVYDIIYNPQETQLLKDASSLNLRTINGIEMLVRQGAASLAIWLEQDIAPLGAMRLAVAECLNKQTVS